MTRILGLDVGDRRIGVAVSDPLGITTRGLFVYERVNIRTDMQRILETVRENECSAVVVGLPLNVSGEDSVQTGKVRAFARRLANTLRSNAMQKIDVILYDERYSTVIAEETMREAGVSEKKIREVIDMRAAEVILQDFIEGRSTQRQ
ncbi:MAG: Holliday junction resolvase RuvX [Clostridiales Family XIII bacterium]|jgi:putative Holliday junction resolvase|nr:Holliday junction resolvase RuvX [Clostridiales Family XIII bacterium]